MVQLKILSGAAAGTFWPLTEFPCRIGRGATANLRIEQAGVWDEHLELDYKPKEGIVATVLSGALATVNDLPIERTVLRSGDVVGLGGAKLQFSLGPTCQSSFQWRERATWITIAILSVTQILVIYLLNR